MFRQNGAKLEANGIHYALELVESDIEIPTIEPREERPHGKWEEIKGSCDGHRFYHCSVCNRFLDVMTADDETLDDYPFCHCGAKMDGKEADNDD